jgi:AcrR family transcriptional regulator
MEKQRSPWHETTGGMEKQDQATPRRRPGGRSARVQAAVFEAALQVLQERGYELTSIAEIAERAGVHETSLYRRWRTKEALLAEALLARTEEVIRVPDTGALRSDLVQFLQELRTFLQSPLGGAIMQQLASTAESTETTAARKTFWCTRFSLAKVMFERAAQRGEIKAPVDPQLVTETIIGPLYVRLLLTNEPLHADLPEQIVDLILYGVEAPVPGSSPAK